MKPQLPSFLRCGLIAIGLAAAATCAPAVAGPSGYLAPPSVLAKATSSPEVVQIQSRRWMRGSRGGSWSGKNWSRRGGDWGRHGNWSGKKWARHGNWSGKNWSRHGNWNRGHWSGRRWNYDHYDNWWPGYATGIILSLGLPRYGYYDPYLYGETYPRRVYRTSSAHVAWCYDRWRSYRESDNSYQPFNGPRRQCRSPYG